MKTKYKGVINQNLLNVNTKADKNARTIGNLGIWGKSGNPTTRTRRRLTAVTREPASCGRRLQKFGKTKNILTHICWIISILCCPKGVFLSESIFHPSEGTKSTYYVCVQSD